MSYSLRSQGLQPARHLCPQDSPGKDTGLGCHSLLQGIFPTQGSNPCLLWFMHWQADSLLLSHLGSTHCFDYYSFMTQLKSGSVIPPPLLFVFKIAIAIHWLLWICRNFRIAFYISVKKSHWNFERNCTECVDCFAQYEHFNNIHSYNP